MPNAIVMASNIYLPIEGEEDPAKFLKGATVSLSEDVIGEILAADEAAGREPRLAVMASAPSEPVRRRGRPRKEPTDE